MKKSTKALLAGLAVIPAALAMTACGGGEPSIIDTNGNYSAQTKSTYAQVEEIMADETITSDFNSYRMLFSINMDMTASSGGQSEKAGMKISSDSLINLNDGFDMKLTNTIEYTGALAQLQMNENLPTKVTEEQYVSNGQVYMWDELGGWSDAGWEESVENQPEFNFDGLFEGITEEEKDGIEVWIDNNTETKTTKIKMTMAAGVLEAFASENSETIGYGAEVEWGTAEVYYVIINGKLEGMKVSIPYTVATESYGITTTAKCKVSMQVAADDAEFDFPAGIEA